MAKSSKRETVISGKREPKYCTGVVLPDAYAVVGILEILHPFGAAERKLILQAVEANPHYPKHTGNGRGIHWVELAEEPPSQKARRLSEKDRILGHEAMLRHVRRTQQFERS